jgi:hypothetical protein
LDWDPRRDHAPHWTHILAVALIALAGGILAVLLIGGFIPEPGAERPVASTCSCPIHCPANPFR